MSKRQRRQRHRRYTDQQVHDMCAAPWQWAEQLRVAAAGRGLFMSSVTPISDVVVALRASMERGK